MCWNRNVVLISSVRTPGQISNQGLGNLDFNRNKAYCHGYEILELYQLGDPISYAKFRTVCRGKATIGWQFAKRQLLTRAPIEDMTRLF